MKTLTLTLLAISFIGAYQLMKQGSFLAATVSAFLGVFLFFGCIVMEQLDKYAAEESERESENFFENCMREDEQIIFRGYKEEGITPSQARTLRYLTKSEEYHSQWN